MSSAGKHDQWIRKVSLIVSNASGQGLDLSQLRVHFKVNQSNFETPNNAEITVYNLAADTAKQIRKEFTSVTLQAGYKDGAFGIIFKGTIKQAKIGRENQTDTFLRISAADGDEIYNFGTVSQSIAAGQSPEDQVSALAGGMGAEVGYVRFDTALQKNIRGKVAYGMGRAQIRNLARSGLSQWSIQNGQITVLPMKTYLPGEAVVLNSQTGMIGLPEQTEEGIRITCLLNPKIQIGTQVQIDQASIQRASVSLNLKDVNQTENAFPPVTDDGFYMVLVAEHEGDTRANEYYSNLVCLSISKSSPIDNSVKVAG